ncbi:MAG: M48 family metalloprotease [Candidatus Omnitrophota bacterium]
MQKIFVICFISLCLLCMGTGCASMPYRVVKDYPEYNHIVELSNQVIRVSDNPQHKIKVFIADLPDGIGGFAKGNSMYLSRRAVSVYPDSDILKLIAHEYAHIECKHRLQQGILSTTITGAFLIGDYFIPGLGWLNHAVNPVIVRAYTVAEEKEANRKATDCMIKMGYDKNTILEYLKMCKSDINLFKYTAHTSIDDEIKDLESYLKTK